MTATVNGHLRPVDRVLDALRAAGRDPRATASNQWSFRVPGREDRDPSGSLSEGDDGRALLHDHAHKASAEDIVSAIGLRMTDLHAPDPNVQHVAHSKPKLPPATHTFIYQDENGEPIRRVTRHDLPDGSKTFRQAHWDGSQWRSGAKNTRCTLFNLPALSAADPETVVYIVEGERHVQRLKRDGLLATTNPMGAGKWAQVEDDILTGRNVVILPDNDKPGYNHAGDVGTRLQGRAASVKIVKLPGLTNPGDDIIDWLDRDGHDVEDLDRLAANEPEWTPERAEKEWDDLVSRESDRLIAEMSTVDISSDGAGDEITIVGFAELERQYPELRPVVIEGLLREGETANLIAPSKAGKSWTAYDAALAIASGDRFLREYQCTQGRVLLIDNELHPTNITHRIPRVAETLGINPDVYKPNLDTISLRGKGVTLPTLGPKMRAIEHGEYRLIIFDAWYRLVPPGTSENDNAAIMALYNQLDAYAESTGAAMMVIHHSSKGSQGEKAVTDVGAGAGSQSRAADTHIVLRPHEQPGCVVLDAALRSFAPVEPIALMWDFPVWRRAFSLDVEDLKGRKSRGEEQQSKRDREGIEAIRDALGSGNGPMSTRAIRDETGMGSDRCNKLLAMLRSDGQITRTSTSGRGPTGHEYQLKS